MCYRKADLAELLSHNMQESTGEMTLHLSLLVGAVSVQIHRDLWQLVEQFLTGRQISARPFLSEDPFPSSSRGLLNDPAVLCGIGECKEGEDNSYSVMVTLPQH